MDNSLAEFVGFDEDVEVGFFQQLWEHAEDVGGGAEISQVVDDQVEEKLREEKNETMWSSVLYSAVILKPDYCKPHVNQIEKTKQKKKLLFLWHDINSTVMGFPQINSKIGFHFRTKTRQAVNCNSCYFKLNSFKEQICI